MTNMDPKRWIDRLSRRVERIIETPQHVLFGGRPLTESASNRLLDSGLNGLATILKRPAEPAADLTGPTAGRFVVRIETGDRPAYECTILQTFTRSEWERLRVGATVDCKIDADKPSLALLVAPGVTARERDTTGGPDQRGNVGAADQRGNVGGADQRRTSGGADQRRTSGAEQRDTPSGAEEHDAVDGAEEHDIFDEPPRFGDSASLIAAGKRANATVLESQPLGMKALGTTDPIFLLTLELRCDEEPEPWQVSFGQRVPKGAEGHVSPGCELHVAYHRPRHDDEVAVDWPATLKESSAEES
jgi:hypothetical protein